MEHKTFEMFVAFKVREFDTLFPNNPMRRWEHLTSIARCKIIEHWYGVYNSLKRLEEHNNGV